MQFFYIDYTSNGKKERNRTIIIFSAIFFFFWNDSRLFPKHTDTLARSIHWYLNPNTVRKICLVIPLKFHHTISTLNRNFSHQYLFVIYICGIHSTTIATLLRHASQPYMKTIILHPQTALCTQKHTCVSNRKIASVHRA